MTRRQRKGYGETAPEALWREALGSGPARLLQNRSGERPAEALWRDTCVSAMTRRLRSGAMPAEALWCDACGSAMTRRLRRRYGASTKETL